MKLTISKNGLMNLLKLATPASSSKATLPVLECVRLQTAGGIISAACTNLELSILAQGIARAEIDGGLCVHARLFGELIANMTGDEIKLEDDGYRMTIKSGRQTAHINGIPETEFPPIGDFRYEGQQIESALLIDAIKKTAFSASKEEARPILQGIAIQGNRGNLTLATTDGFRLSIKTLPVDIDLKAIIPAKALKMVASLAAGDEVIKMRKQDDNRVFFTGAGWQLATQLIDGNYPDYSVILPKRVVTKLSLKANDLKGILLQAKAIGANGVEFKVNGATTISAQSEEIGSVEAVIEQAGEGPEQKFSLNYEYLAEALGVIGGDVTLSIIDHKSPLILRGEDQNYQHVLMPLFKG
jgi:DNA polymerase-3 subunit beta